MPYCMYLRKSRADAEAELRGEGETLSRHRAALTALAKAKRLEVTAIYEEIVSGETIASRPVMQQLLDEVSRGMWDAVLVMEVERLARGDTMDQGLVAQTFKFSGTKIITPQKVYDPDNEFDEEYFEFGLFMARREYKTINRRLQRGRIASVDEGKYVGSLPPFGYDKKRLEHDKGYTLTENKKEADAVRLIFDLYVRENLGVGRIADRLNTLGVRPRKNEYWSPASIRDILQNPVYIGKIRWNWRKQNKKMVDGHVVVSRPKSAADNQIIVNGLHPAIISDEIFSAAEQMMSRRQISPCPEKHTVKNPLSGVLVCAKCGRKMIRRPYSNGYPDTIMCPNRYCDNISAAMRTVEDKLISALRAWVDAYQFEIKASKSTPAASSIDAPLQSLTAEVETLKKQLDATFDLLEQGVYDADRFTTRCKNISERIKAAEKKISALQAKKADADRRYFARSEIIPKVEHLIAVYDSLSGAEQKNTLLKEVLEKVTYQKDKNGRWHNSPDDFTLTVYPRIPDFHTDN